MDTWRLSRIEDELEKLDFTQEPTESLSSSIFNSLSGDLGFTFATTPGVGNKYKLSRDDGHSKVDEGYSEEEEAVLDEEQEEYFPPPPDELEEQEEYLPPPPDSLEEQEDYLPPPPDELLYPVEDDPPDDSHPDYNINSTLLVTKLPSLKFPYHREQDIGSSSNKIRLSSKGEEIYSEAFIKGKSFMGDVEKRRSDAVKHFSDKYDSLNRMKMSPFPAIIPPGYITMKRTSLSKSSESILKDIPPNDIDGGVMDIAAGSSIGARRKSSENILSHVPSSSPRKSVHSADMFDHSSRDLNSFESHGLKPSLQNDIDEQNAHSSVIEESHSNKCIKRTVTPSLTEQEILQVDIFYRSHKSKVFVCQCVAELYFGSVRNSKTFDNFYSESNNSSGWTLIKPGVPALVLDTAERKLHLIFAEKGTGFTLWKETVTNATNYTAVQPNFHTLHLVNDPSKLVGLSFQDSSGASDFLHKLNSIITNPDNEDIINPGKKGKKKKKEKKNKLKKPTSKADISAPCCFTHITALDRTDGLETTGNVEENIS